VDLRLFLIRVSRRPRPRTPVMVTEDTDKAMLRLTARLTMLADMVEEAVKADRAVGAVLTHMLRKCPSLALLICSYYANLGQQGAA
jgi:hypothetical protein